MLYDLVPNVDITGGAWFTDNELDTEMINALSKVALRYIAEQCKTRNANAILPASFRYPSATSVLEFVNNKGVLMQELGLGDIKDLLNMLVDARQLERVDLDSYRPDPRCSIFENELRLTSGGTEEEYKSNYWTEMPCGRCPVFDQCSPIGKITPSKCEYFTQWLSF